MEWIKLLINKIKARILSRIIKKLINKIQNCWLLQDHNINQQNNTKRQ